MNGRVESDVEKACQYLVEHPTVKVVAAKEGNILGFAEGTGIRPLLALVDQLGVALTGASVADRVIGRAAAFILIEARVAGAYGETLSTEAEQQLHEAGIEVSGGQRVPCILRPDGLERCVMEQQVIGVEDAAEAVQRLRGFLK